jgi:hypothetical protein
MVVTAFNPAAAQSAGAEASITRGYRPYFLNADTFQRWVTMGASKIQGETNMRFNNAAGFAICIIASALSGPAHTQGVVCQKYGSRSYMNHALNGITLHCRSANRCITTVAAGDAPLKKSQSILRALGAIGRSRPRRIATARTIAYTA